MAKKKILFVDDEPHVVILMKRRLEHVGYEVTTAADGRDAFAKAQKDQPDLLVVDQTMPQMTGVELCHLLKKEPAAQKIPVIIYTANTERGIEAKCIEAGAVGVIYKPLVAELLILIKHVLDGEKIDWAEYTA